MPTEFSVNSVKFIKSKDDLKNQGTVIVEDTSLSFDEFLAAGKKVHTLNRLYLRWGDEHC